MLRPLTQVPAGTSPPGLISTQAWKQPLPAPALHYIHKPALALLTEVPRLIIRTLQVTGTLALTLGLAARPGAMVSAETGTCTN